MEKNGFLYIGMGKKYRMEAEISARSMKQYTKYPICLITEDPNYKNEYFDIIIVADLVTDFYGKIVYMQKSPFENTLYLDCDTFICSSIDHIFQAMDLFDMSLSPDRFYHDYGFIAKYNPSYKIKYENVIVQYHCGVILYRMNDAMRGFFKDWERIHLEQKMKSDMLSFRDAYIENASKITICPLPFEYNYHGTHAYGVANMEIKVIHERLGEKWNTITTVMLPFEQMQKKAKKFNKYHGRRIIIPYIGVIPYYWNLYHIKRKLKKIFGVKRTPKAETF
jgi:hypothetical protein